MTPSRFQRPCIDCGQLSYGSRCDTHEQERKAKRPRTPDSEERKAKKRLLYNSDYRRRAKLVRQNAIECHLCGGGYNPLDPWEADHVYPSDPNSILLPAHRSCNRRKSNNPNPKTTRQ